VSDDGVIRRTGIYFTQYGMVPEEAAYVDLDVTAYRVLIIYASKAGKDRVAWIAHREIAERLGLARTTIDAAVKRLERAGLMRKVGRVVINRERGTWTFKYRIALTNRLPSQLPEAKPEVASASHPKPIQADPMPIQRVPDANPGLAHSDLSSSNLSSSAASPRSPADAGSAPPAFDPWAAQARNLIAEGHDENDVALAMARVWCRTHKPGSSLEGTWTVPIGRKVVQELDHVP
jgi:DNA-binding MarR family transcriptional regulator